MLSEGAQPPPPPPPYKILGRLKPPLPPPPPYISAPVLS